MCYSHLVASLLPRISCPELFPGLDIPFPRAPHDLLAHGPPLAVFTGLQTFLEPLFLQPVAQVLLVEARLWTARRVARGGPVAGRVGREGLVDEDEFVLGAGRRRDESELELRVGEDEPAGERVAGGLGVQLDRDGRDPVAEILSDEFGGWRYGLASVSVCVMALSVCGTVEYLGLARCSRRARLDRLWWTA